MFGTVARTIKLKPPEGQSPKMKTAIEKERQNHVGKGTWNYKGVLEYDKARQIEKAQFARANLILVEKNAEDQNA